MESDLYNFILGKVDQEMNREASGRRAGCILWLKVNMCSSTIPWTRRFCPATMRQFIEMAKLLYHQNKDNEWDPGRRWECGCMVPSLNTAFLVRASFLFSKFNALHKNQGISKSKPRDSIQEYTRPMKMKSPQIKFEDKYIKNWASYDSFLWAPEIH